MNIWYSPYFLKFKREVKAKHKSSEGLLLKIEENGRIYYSTYHPIESLGDRSIQKFINDFTVATFKQSNAYLYKLCIEDFQSIELKSYYSAISFEDIKNAVNFDLIKIKLRSLEELEQNIFFLEGFDKKYILDFNLNEKVSSFEFLSDGLKSFISKYVDYIEDPYPALGKFNFKLASDFFDYQELSDIKIHKPMAPTYSKSLGLDDVVTSYLDHPLGQIQAMSFADKNNIKRAGGYLTHHFFKETKYSEFIELKSRVLLDGIEDFKVLLNQESWVKL